MKRIASLSIRSIAGLHLFTSAMYEISQTEGASMLPTLQTSGDFVIIDKSYKNGNSIQMGDILVARKPTQPDHWVCKRVTGMPGDVVLLDPSMNHIDELHQKYDTSKIATINDDSTINDKCDVKLREIKINKSNSSNKKNPYDMYIIIPEGHVWVTGDNLSDSVDSRTYSVMPMGLIGGKIIIGMYLPNLLNFKGNYYRFLGNTFNEI